MPTDIEDIVAIKKALAGEPEAFRGLVDRYQKPVLSFLYNILGSREHVEELGQEVFLKAYRSLASFDAGRGTSFSTWLFAIARHACTDLLRKMGRPYAGSEKTRGEAEACSDESASEGRGLLEEALNSLPEDQRFAVEWVLIQGLSYEAAARLEEISIGTLSSRLARAKESLQQSLQGESLESRRASYAAAPGFPERVMAEVRHMRRAARRLFWRGLLTRIFAAAKRRVY